jgi:predicted AAA+ superfamily ATPase
VLRLIQVTRAGARSEVRERELRALELASEELGCNDALVITWDYAGDEALGDLRVRYVPLWAWLLEGQ